MDKTHSSKKIEFWIALTNDIISIWSKQGGQATKIKHSFFTERRYLGSNDKKIIGGIFFFYLRTWNYTNTLSATELFFLAYNNVTIIKISVNKLVNSDDLNTYIYTLIKNDSFLTEFADLRSAYFFSDFYKKNLNCSEVEIENLCESLNSEATTDIRVICNKESVEQELIENKIGFRYNILKNCIKLKANTNFQTYKSYQKGYFEVQDEASQLVSILLSPKPYEDILDYCSGGGGKTLHIASITNDLANITATDINTKRLGSTAKRIIRHKLKSVRIVEMSDVDNSNKVFDRILVDAPCSGSGTVRRNPEIRYSITPERLGAYAVTQLEILEKNWEKLKTGGELTYATCSLFTKENDDVILQFSNTHNNINVINLRDRLTKLDIEPDNFYFTHYGLATLPHKTNTDGFFICILRKE